MTVKLKTKFKKFAKFNANINDHPKIKFGKFTRRKWAYINSSKSKKLTNYGQILEAKQSLRSFYGNISEKHFRKLYLKGKTSKNNAGLNLIQLLETRLDTILYRIGLSNSLDEVRQFISHKHILVNNNIITIPSYQVKPEDVIKVNPLSYSFIYNKIQNRINTSLNIKSFDYLNKDKTSLNEVTKDSSLLFCPNYLYINFNLLEAKLLYSPSLEELIFPTKVDLGSIIEYYEYKIKI